MVSSAVSNNLKPEESISEADAASDNDASEQGTDSSACETPIKANAQDSEDDAEDDDSQAQDELVEERALVGQTVAGRYRITELIGLGGMGAVYRAEHIQLRKQVALKVLHREMTALPEIVARFEREAVAAGRIHHPNVVKARDFGRLDNGSYYLALDYVEGQTLNEALDNEQRFELERALLVGLQVAQALEAAHHENIVHRDLKPDNVMLVRRDDGAELVKVLDFGIAKVNLTQTGSGEEPLTKMGVVFGTPEYMSPEQAAGQEVDTRGDVYALGLLLYRMLAGRPPFSSEQVNAVLMMQITRPPPELPGNIPGPVREFVSELLKKDPEQRLTSASLAIARLSELLASPEVVANPSRQSLASVPGLFSKQSLTLGQKLDRSMIGRPVPLGPNRIPAWRFGLLSLVFVGLCYGLVELLAAQKAHREATPTAAYRSLPETDSARDVSSSLEPVDPELEKQIAAAFAGDLTAAAQLEQRPKSERDVRQWLALGRAYSKANKSSLAVQAYAEALALDNKIAVNATLRRDLWEATKDPASAEASVRLIAQYLGARGADMLYHVWVDTKEVTPLTRLAKNLLYEPKLRKQASPALAFLLDWREAISCDDYQELVPRAALSGDHRALTLLQRATIQTDCALSQEALEAAIAAVKERPEPNGF